MRMCYLQIVIYLSFIYTSANLTGLGGKCEVQSTGVYLKKDSTVRTPHASFSTLPLKGLSHGCLVHFLNISNYASLCAMELKFI